MTDLFETLSQRFVPGAPVAIRPRPQSRFEANTADEGLVEEDNLDVVRTPQTPKTPKDNPRDANPAPLVTDARTPPTQHTISSPKETGPRDTASPAEPAQPEQINVDAPQSPPLTHEIHANRSVDPELRPRIGHASPTPVAHPAQTPATKTETIREIHHEKTADPTAAPPPIQTRIAPAPDRQPDPVPVPTAQEPGTVVRIGRVEIRQPAPPPPAPPPPKRTTGNSGPAGISGSNSRSQSRGSGLTDYLGWKRK